MYDANKKQNTAKLPHFQTLGVNSVKPKSTTSIFQENSFIPVSQSGRK